METNDLQICVDQAQARKDADNHSTIDEALLQYHEAALRFVDHMEAQDRALDVYKTSSAVPADTLRKVASLEQMKGQLERELATALAQNTVLKSTMAQRASSGRWEKIKQKLAMKMQPVDRDVDDYVQALLASIVRH